MSVWNLYQIMPFHAETAQSTCIEGNKRSHFQGLLCGFSNPRYLYRSYVGFCKTPLYSYYYCLSTGANQTQFLSLAPQSFPTKIIYHQNKSIIKTNSFISLKYWLQELNDRTSLVAQMVKHLPTMQETWVRSRGWEDPLEKGKATHSSILAWSRKWHPTPILLPGKSHGQRSLAGDRPQGRNESDTTEHLSIGLILCAMSQEHFTIFS